MLGLNRNDHSTAAIAGATAYGQISSVWYAFAPRVTRSAHAASSSEITSPDTVTSAQKIMVVLNDDRYSGSVKSCLKLREPDELARRAERVLASAWTATAPRLPATGKTPP